MNEKTKDEVKKTNDLVLFFTHSEKIITMNDSAFLWILLAVAFLAMSLSFLAGKVVPERIDNLSIIFTFVFSVVCFWFYKHSLKTDA